MTISIHLNQFCVYTHSIDNEVFYVGKGSASRPFYFDNRNDIWNRLTSKSGIVKVNIVSWHADSESALKAESILIKKIKPKANIAAGCEEEPRTEVLHIALTKNQLRQLKIIAEANNRTLVNQVFAIIADALNGGRERGR